MQPRQIGFLAQQAASHLADRSNNITHRKLRGLAAIKMQKPQTQFATLICNFRNQLFPRFILHSTMRHDALNLLQTPRTQIAHGRNASLIFVTHRKMQQ